MIILLVVFIGIPSLVYSRLQEDKILNHNDATSTVETNSMPIQAKNNQTVQQGIHKEEMDLQQHELERIAIIIDSSTDCYAKNAYGDLIDISIEACKKLSRKNSLMSFSKVKKDHYQYDNSVEKSNSNIEYTPPIYPKS